MVCEWLRTNPDIWKEWVPFRTSVLDFENTLISLDLPVKGTLSRHSTSSTANGTEVTVIHLNVVRKESHFGALTVSYKDLTHDLDIGMVLLKQNNLQPAVYNQHYIIDKENSTGERTLEWRDKQSGIQSIPLNILKGDDGYGIVVGIVDVVADSAIIGPHSIVVIGMHKKSCDEVVPGREGGMFLFDNFSRSQSVDVAGTWVTTLFLFVFAFEFVILIVFVIWKDTSSDTSKKSKGAIQPVSGSNISSTSDHRRNSSHRHSGIFQYIVFIPSLCFRQKDNIIQINPVVDNLYPVLAVIMDFPQFVSIITSTDIDWLRDSSVMDIISLSSISLRWYFWLIVLLVLPWVMYVLALLTGVDSRMEKTVAGRIILFPSDYLVPLGASVLFIPAITNLLRVFTCVLTSEDTGFPPMILNEECSITCWDSTHWIYAVVGGAVLIVYWPMAVYASPLWQNVKGGDVQVIYRSRFFHLDVLMKTLLVVSRVFFRQFVILFYTVVIICLLLYLLIFVSHRPCRVPWIVNLRIFIYASLLVISLFVVCTWGAGNSIAFPITLVVGFVCSLAIYIHWDHKRYPQKLIYREDQTREKIRQFLATFGETESYNSSQESLQASVAANEGKENSKSGTRTGASSYRDSEKINEQLYVCGICTDEEREVKSAVQLEELNANDWLSLETFTFGICKRAGMAIEEYEFIAYLTVIKCELILDMWKRYEKNDDDGVLNWIKSISSATRDFHKMDRSKGLLDGMEKERQSVLAEQRPSTVIRLRRRTNSFNTQNMRRSETTTESKTEGWDAMDDSDVIEVELDS